MTALLPTEVQSTSPAWRRGLLVQLRVIHALMMRDALKRYGHENLGFFWVIGEPLLFTCGIMLLWSLAGLHEGSNVAIIPFALTGYSFITMWRHITGRSMGALKHNTMLTYHRQVSVLDSVISMAFLEVISCFTSFMIAYIPLYLFGECPLVRDPLELIGGYFLAGVFSFGFGLFLAGLSDLSEVMHHVTPAIMYMSMPLTGIFTMQQWLPDRVREVVAWSPLVNGIEMFRSGMFSEDVKTYWSLSYLVVSGLITILVGYGVFSFAKSRSSH